MKKHLLVIIPVFILSTNIAGATTVQDCPYAHVGATTYNPINYEPKTLVTMSPGYTLNSTDKAKIKYDDADVYYWDDNTTPEKNYNYILVQFTTPSPAYDEALCAWQVWVSGGDDVYFYRWKDDEESWDYLTENDGGSDPEVVRVDVTDYFGDEYLTLLVVGATNGPGEDRISCDVLSLITDP